MNRKRIVTIAIIFVTLCLIALLAVKLQQKSPACDTSDYGGTCTVSHGDPTIIDILPKEVSIKGGDEVLITGTNFGPGVKVWFGGRPAVKVRIANSVKLYATTSPVSAPQAADVSVARGNGPKYTMKHRFRFEDTFKVTSVTPASGPAAGGTTVTIKGSGFSQDTYVSFQGALPAKKTVVDQHTIRVVTPAHDTGTVEINFIAGEDEFNYPQAFTFQ